MRLIDADTRITLQIYDEEREEYHNEKMTVGESLDMYSEEGCPPTVEPKRGRWITKMVWSPVSSTPRNPSSMAVNPPQLYACSECGWCGAAMQNYCPWCGAMMEWSEDDA